MLWLCGLLETYGWPLITVVTVDCGFQVMLCMLPSIISTWYSGHSYSWRCSPTSCRSHQNCRQRWDICQKLLSLKWMLGKARMTHSRKGCRQQQNLNILRVLLSLEIKIKVLLCYTSSKRLWTSVVDVRVHMGGKTNSHWIFTHAMHTRRLEYIFKWSWICEISRRMLRLFPDTYAFY